MIMPSLSRLAGWSLVLGAGAVLCAVARAQTTPAAPVGDPLPLGQFVVSASRTPQDPKFVASSVTTLALADLAAAQVTDLRTALSAQAGVGVVSSGAVGGQTSVFLRGSNSYQTLFIVDGVRMNDRAALYSNFLGGADLAGLGRIEVLRGPQSTLYGSSAMGGVIVLDTARGCGPAGGSLATTVGSFDTRGATATAQGGTRTFGYSASLGYLETANDRPANAYRQWSGSTRLEELVTPALLVGVTFRGQRGDSEEPGSLVYAAPGKVQADNTLATAYAEAKAGDHFTSRLTLGQHRRSYTYTSTGAYGYVSELKNRREVLDWQNTWAATEQLEVVAGANRERSHYTIDAAESSDDVTAGFLSLTARLSPAVALTAGLRHDDFQSAGGATTGRTGLAWLPLPGTKFHATYGTGFTAPGSDDRYGVANWGQLPSPGLQPEESRGWDAGLDQTLLSGALTLSATYFENRFRELFQWTYVSYVTYEGRIVNIDRATTSGAELAAAWAFGPAVKSRLAYTYLDARDDTTQQRLIRRPRHTLDAEVQVQLAPAWQAGAGLHVVAGRLDAGPAMPDYTTVRLFASYAVNDRLRLKLRAENALNRDYQEVYGYPALPRAAYASADWRF